MHAHLLWLCNAVFRGDFSIRATFKVCKDYDQLRQSSGYCAFSNLEQLLQATQYGKLHRPFTHRCYRVGDVKGAGTDADVQIRFIANKEPAASLQWHPLVAGKDAFERGKVDNFLVSCNYLGSLEAIEISHNSHGHNPSWFCQQVVVTDQVSGARNTFPVHEWLAQDSANGCSRICHLQDGSSTDVVTYTVRVMVLFC